MIVEEYAGVDRARRVYTDDGYVEHQVYDYFAKKWIITVRRKVGDRTPGVNLNPPDGEEVNAFHQLRRNTPAVM
jgi:hypothetical protein